MSTILPKPIVDAMNRSSFSRMIIQVFRFAVPQKGFEIFSRRVCDRLIPSDLVRYIVDSRSLLLHISVSDVRTIQEVPELVTQHLQRRTPSDLAQQTGREIPEELGFEVQIRLALWISYLEFRR